MTSSELLYFIAFIIIRQILQPLATAGHHLDSLCRNAMLLSRWEKRCLTTNNDCQGDQLALYTKCFVLNNSVTFTSGPQCLLYQMNNFYCNSLTNGQFKKFVTNFEQRTNRKRHLIKSGRDFIYPGLLSILMLQKDLENSTEIIIQNYWK